jgi:hypothetical protein
MSTLKTHLPLWVTSLVLLGLLGCGGAQTFLQESGAAHKSVEKMNWVNEPSAQATNWTTYMDLEGG